MALLTGAAALTGSAARAETSEGCVAITQDEERLACFDALFAETDPGGEAATPVGDEGKWEVTTEVSPMTDETTVVLSLLSDEAIPGPFGGMGPATLMLRCQENTTSAFLVFNDHFMADIQGHGRVEYRIDEESMDSVSMAVSTNNKALGLWDGERAIPWITMMIGHDRLVVRATPFSESALTATFDIAGLDVAVDDLRSTCGW